MMLLWACIAWVLASVVVAFLPMRRQILPGSVLLALAPVLIIWVGIATQWWVAVLALMAFVSMYRNPLRYFMARARGEHPEIPK